MSFFSKKFSRKNKRLYSCYSDKGIKSVNEDSRLLCENGNSILMIVADGVGGHSNGQYASKRVVAFFQEQFNFLKSDDPIPSADFLRMTTITIAEEIFNKGKFSDEFKNCGSTVSGVLITGNEYYTLNVGDSRVYLFKKPNELKRLTVDHSLIYQLYLKGEISEEEMKTHPQKNIITSAIGQSLNRITVTVEGPYFLMKNDVILVCSDGVHSVMNDIDIAEILNENTGVSNIAEILVKKAISSGSRDNVTACILVN